VRLTKIVLISIITVVTGLALFADESKDLTWPKGGQNSQLWPSIRSITWSKKILRETNSLRYISLSHWPL
jgi:hypothetical protein